MMLEEYRLRKDDFADGFSVLLDDDQRWYFPIAIRGFRYSLDPDRLPVEVFPDRDGPRKFTRSFWEKQDRYREYLKGVTDETRIEEFAQRTLPVVVDLIRRNYELTIDQAVDLFPVCPGNEKNKQLWISLGELAAYRPRDLSKPEPQPIGS